MRNRAKCKLCNSIIESFHRHDYVTCLCGEISVDGGQDYFRASAKDFNNFLRVDDNGNEIEIRVVEKGDTPFTEIKEDMKHNISRKDLIENLSQMIKAIESLPPNAMTTSVNQYDFCSLLILLHSIFVLEDGNQNQNKVDEP